MSTGHCFISYSNRDAEDFGTQLANELEGGNPFIEAWFDKRDIPAGSKWNDKVPQAIQSCKCLIFALTKDSVTNESICGDELDLALRYKKPILIIRLQNDVEPPFRLGEVQWIDFLENRKAGWAKLRLAIQRVDSAEGQLDFLKARFSAANRDLSNAKSEEEKLRIQSDIEELTKEIQIQQKIVDNPKAAEEQTQKNIDAGLERERQPEKPVTTKTSTKFINPPPGIAPNYFQDRFIETKQIVDFLNDDSKRLMTVVGRAGVGKTALICRLLKGIESGQLPDELGEMKADGIVYLSEAGSHRINFANIFSDLIKLLSNEVSSKLENLYKNPQTSTKDKMQALLDAFTDGRIILLLDNFENLIDSESLNVKDNELSEALNALLNSPQHMVKVIITTRIAPRDLALVESGRQRQLSLDEGLESPYAENVLRELDANGHIGLKDASEDLLKKAREKTRGYPRALEALYAILSVDRYTTLEELLTIKMPDEVVHTLVGEAFNRLDLNAQMVMQALAIYNRPVSPAAIDYLLQPHLPSIDSALVLNRLVNMHFARREAGRYYLHPADKEYAFSIIPVEEPLTTKDTKVTKENQEERGDSPLPEGEGRVRENFTQHDLLNRAADYFAQARKPRAEWKKLDDLSAQLAEFDLRCAAGDYDTAASVLREIDFDYLLLWGHFRLLIDLHMRLKDKITDKNSRMGNLNGLGFSHYRIGKVIDSINFYEQGLITARETKNQDWEGAFLGNLGSAYLDLGETRKSIEFLEQQLKNEREIGVRKREGNALGNLGNAYTVLGDVQKSIEYYEQALVIFREIGDRSGEGKELGNLASAYAAIAETRKAIELYEQAIIVAREIGDKFGEETRLLNLVEVYLDDGQNNKAILSAQESLKIALELNILSSYEFGNLALAYFYNGDLKKARDHVEQAELSDVPQNNHNVTALHGIIALRQGERETAQEAFAKSIAQADEILAKTPDYYSALDAKGLALVGAGLIRQMNESSGKDARQDETNVSKERPARTQEIEQAIETFQKARKIAPHAGVIKGVLRLFDELAKCEGGEILKDVRKAVEGKE